MDNWKTYTLPFGRYKGETMYVVLINDWDYICWLDNRMLGPRLRSAVDAAITYHREHLNKKEK